MRLYVHWPFCLARCAYCDFETRTASPRCRDAYRHALLAESHAWAGLLDRERRQVHSTYLGGGSPSTLGGAEVAELLREVTACFSVLPGAEVTVEVNPAGWSREDFDAARAGGVNRISVGVQSLHDPTLRLLGRSHDAYAARKAVDHALGCGARSVSVDLLYGLPGMDRDTLLHFLEEVIVMGPHHVSLYALTLSGRSPLSRAVSRAEVILPGEDEVADQYLAAVETLRGAGYAHYEISNFCLPGHHSRHNLGYWRREEYLGLGAAAHSFLGGSRFRNTVSVLDYSRRLARGRPAVDWWEMLGAEDERTEAIMLGLRTCAGVPEGLVSGHHGYLDDLESAGLLAREGGWVSLTARGMLVSNAVIAELMPA